MGIEFGRDGSHLDIAASREWLVTNGIGGYASGTVAGLLTRRYHGLLVAALKPPLGRALLLAKLDETALYSGHFYHLYTNRWTGDTVEPHGYRHIEHFQLEGTLPVWQFACADALLEKRVWMQPGNNTTYIRYQLRRATQPLTLTLKAMVNYRDYHSSTQAQDWRMTIAPVASGVSVSASPQAVPFYLVSDRATVSASHTWYYGFELAVESYRGLGDREDHLHAASFEAVLEPGASLTFVASTEQPDLNGEAALQARRQHEQQLLDREIAEKNRHTPGWFKQLVLAADQFIVSRPSLQEPDGKTIIAGYHWFSDWGRDTLISLPGLTLTTGRPEIARSILQTYARYVDQGMVPNRFPDSGETPEYNTVDASLWYFQAVRAYHAATGDDVLLRSLFPVLAGMIDWYYRGTRYNIHCDPADGLLYAGEVGVQLTWMDAKVGDWVVTPRIGKPVEVNALWYNALQAMARFADQLGKPYQEYETIANCAFNGFARFWNNAAGYCYDVLDGPNGNDAALRPNQIFAVSLPESPLTATQQRQVVDTCARTLLTSHGLRSLAPDDPQYQGHYGGSPQQRDAAYHQGTVWGWLIGPFVLAHLRVYDDPMQARTLLRPMANHLSAHGLGSLSEIFDGNAPMPPRGCIAQAWTVAEVLRAWLATGAPIEAFRQKDESCSNLDRRDTKPEPGSN